MILKSISFGNLKIKVFDQYCNYQIYDIDPRMSLDQCPHAAAAEIYAMQFHPGMEVIHGSFMGDHFHMLIIKGPLAMD